MTKLTTILQESYEIYQFTALIKNYKSINKSEIFNKLRAVPYVIRIKVIEDPRLDNINKKYDYEYTLIKVKFLNIFGMAEKGARIIKNISLDGRKGFYKIDGLIDFKILPNTMHKV